MRYPHLAALAASLTLALMVLGSLVHGTGSSLACPDWPLCHGTAFPRMTGGVEFEHSHRLVALLVASIVVALALRARRLADARARLFAYLAVTFVAVQASLGALTVVLRLPPAVSIAHLATSQLVLVSLVVLTVRTATPHRRGRHGAHGWVGAALVAAWTQAIAGAFVRHTGAALACATFPTCNGALWPDSPVARVHVVHRAGAIVVTTLILLATCVVRGRAANDARLRAIALVPALLVAAQIALGVGVVLGGTTLGLVTAHHATGALLVASLAAEWALAERTGGPQPALPSGRGDARMGTYTAR
jgi:heme A synthase